MKQVLKSSVNEEPYEVGWVNEPQNAEQPLISLHNDDSGMRYELNLSILLIKSVI